MRLGAEEEGDGGDDGGDGDDGALGLHRV